MKKLLPFSILLIAFILLGCSLTINAPSIETTTLQQKEVSIPLNSSLSESVVQIEMGGGKLNITSGADGLVEGTISYNVLAWEPEVTETASGATITQTHSQNVGIPEDTIKNDWDLKLGSSPIALEINAGAYEGTIDLSGLSITELEVNDGASKAVVRFDEPNPVEMRRLVYKTGASKVDLLGLGNANVSEINFESGAGSYTLDFSGEISKDMSISITSGMSDISLVVPSGVHTIMNLTGGLSNINASGTWTMDGSRYESGSGSPTITISVEMAVGNLSISQK